MTSSTPDETSPDTSTDPSPDTLPDTLPDATSDPSLDDGSSGDWTDEGGAVTEGPATDTEDDPEHPSHG